MPDKPTVGLWQAVRQDTLRDIGVGGTLTERNASELEQVEMAFPSFVGGLNYQAAEQDQALEFTQETYDVVITDRNRLKRGPGHLVAVDLAPIAAPVAMFVHTSLDFTTELVLLQPPNIVIIPGTGVVDDAAIALPLSMFWVGLTNGEDFLFSDGKTGIWQRPFGAIAGASLIPNAPGARTMANFAGRVLVGGPTISGQYEALGVYWSGADGLITNWLGIGA